MARNALLALIPVAAAAAVLLIVWRPQEETRRSEPSALALPAEATAKPAVRVTPEITPRRPPDISLEVFVPPPAADPRETFSKSPPAEEPAAPPAAAAPPPAPAPVLREVSDPAPRESGVSVTRIEPPGPPMVASGSPMIVRSEQALPFEEPQPSQGARPSPPARARSYVGAATAPSGARLTLDGIVYSDENPAAVVNGRVVSVGSFVDGCEVVRIRPDRVELDDGGSRIVLLLK